MNESFDRAFELVIGHEGGYTSGKNDPGGETKFGISKRVYPSEDIIALTIERAKEIYKRDYWDKLHCSDMPKAIVFPLFDAGVNCGIRRAAEWLQELCRVEVDGSIGPRTLEAVAQANGPLLAAKLNATRLKFQASLPGWEHFGKGWARRIAENILLIGS